MYFSTYNSALFSDKNIDFQKDDEQATGVDLDHAVGITYKVKLITQISSHGLLYIYIYIYI